MSPFRLVSVFPSLSWEDFSLVRLYLKKSEGFLRCCFSLWFLCEWSVWFGTGVGWEVKGFFLSSHDLNFTAQLSVSFPLARLSLGGWIARLLDLGMHTMGRVRLVRVLVLHINIDLFLSRNLAIVDEPEAPSRIDSISVLLIVSTPLDRSHGERISIVPHTDFLDYGEQNTTGFLFFDPGTGSHA